MSIPRSFMANIKGYTHYFTKGWAVLENYKKRSDMTQREKRDLIRSLKKEIKAQMPIILDSIQCNTMTPEQIAYFRSGVGKGMEVCIDILSEEE